MKIKRIALGTSATIFTAGKVIASIGETAFIFNEGALQLGLDSLSDQKLLNIGRLFVSASGIYVMLFTRFPALLRFFMWDPKTDKIGFWDGKTLAQKLTTCSFSFLNVGVAIAEGLQGYLGAHTLLEIFNISEWLTEKYGEEAGSITVAAASTLVGTSCVLAYLTFFAGKSVQNSLRLVTAAQEINFTKENIKPIIWTSFNISITSILASITKACLAYLMSSEALKLIYPSISPVALKSTSGLISLASYVTYIPSHFGEVFNFFTSKEKPLIKTYCKFVESKKDKLIVLPHWVMGIVNILAFMLETFFTLVAVTAPTNFSLWMLFGLACLSAGFTHYVFTIQPMIDHCIKNRNSYNEIAEENNKKSDGEYSKWCCLFNRADPFAGEVVEEDISDENIHEEDSSLNINNIARISTNYSTYNS